MEEYKNCDISVDFPSGVMVSRLDEKVSEVLAKEETAGNSSLLFLCVPYAQRYLRTKAFPVSSSRSWILLIGR